MIDRGITAKTMEGIRKEMGRVIKGQEEFIHLLLICLFSKGHVLVEGVPGLGKTLAVRALAAVADVDFHRIQFTPDMMPSDITGTNIYDLRTQTFHLKKGPLFTNFLLADEINRTPPKTQSALLEAMEERCITVDGKDYPLDEPFMVFATQNPIEFEGTYPLPEAQLDRFMMKLLVDYPGEEEEKDVLRQYHQGFDSHDFGGIRLNKLIHRGVLEKCREEIRQVRVDESIFSYIMAIVGATRQSRHLLLGASPRASIALLMASKTLAAAENRDYVIPDDAKYLSLPVLRHRVLVSPESEIEGVRADDVIYGILNQVKVPR
ncbi:MAG: AAA family ATPase [Clostridia bacterium]|jgi:MoxR-like ATPase